MEGLASVVLDRFQCKMTDAMTTLGASLPVTVRVAGIQFGEGGMIARANEAADGMTLVVSLDGARELPIFGTMPEFDIVVKNVPADPPNGVRPYDVRTSWLEFAAR